MAALLPLTEVSRRTGISTRTLCNICRRLGLAKIGRDWLLSEDDVRRVARLKRGPGNPTGKSAE